MALTSNIPTLAQIQLCTPSNRVQRVECVNGVSNKYYEVYIVAESVDYAWLLTRHGKIGTLGVVTRKGTLLSNNNAAFEAGKLLGAKLKKGYVAVNFGKKASNSILEGTSKKKKTKSKKVVEVPLVNRSANRFNYIDFD